MKYIKIINKKVMKKLFTLLVLCFVFLPHAKAQVNDLTESDIQAFKDRVGEIIDMFQNNLSILGGKKYPLKVIVKKKWFANYTNEI